MRVQVAAPSRHLVLEIADPVDDRHIWPSWRPLLQHRRRGRFDQRLAGAIDRQPARQKRTGPRGPVPRTMSVEGCGGSAAFLDVLAVVPLVHHVGRALDVALVVERDRPEHGVELVAVELLDDRLEIGRAGLLDRLRPRPGSRRRCRGCSPPGRSPRPRTPPRPAPRPAFLRGSGLKVISVPCPVSPVIAQYSSVTRASPDIMRGVDALLLGLARDQARLGVIAAEVDQIDAGVLHLGDQRGEVLVARGDRLVHGLL